MRPSPLTHVLAWDPGHAPLRLDPTSPSPALVRALDLETMRRTDQLVRARLLLDSPADVNADGSRTATYGGSPAKRCLGSCPLCTDTVVGPGFVQVGAVQCSRPVPTANAHEI
jgi:hypothetical protein